MRGRHRGQVPQPAGAASTVLAPEPAALGTLRDGSGLGHGPRLWDPGPLWSHLSEDSPDCPWPQTPWYRGPRVVMRTK